MNADRKRQLEARIARQQAELARIIADEEARVAKNKAMLFAALSECYAKLPEDVRTAFGEDDLTLVLSPKHRSISTALKPEKPKEIKPKAAKPTKRDAEIASAVAKVLSVPFE